MVIKNRASIQLHLTGHISQRLGFVYKLHCKCCSRHVVVHHSSTSSCFMLVNTEDP
jgi:hypothetical protein